MEMEQEFTRNNSAKIGANNNPFKRGDMIQLLADRYNSASTEAEKIHLSNIAARVLANAARDSFNTEQEEFKSIYRQLNPVALNASGIDMLANYPRALASATFQYMSDRGREIGDEKVRQYKGETFEDQPSLLGKVAATTKYVVETPGRVWHHGVGEFTEDERQQLAQFYDLPEAKSRLQAYEMWQLGDAAAAVNFALLAAPLAKAKLPTPPSAPLAAVTAEGQTFALASADAAAATATSSNPLIIPSIVTASSLKPPAEDTGNYSSAARQPGMKDQMDEKLKIIALVQNSGEFTKLEIGWMFQDAVDELGVTMQDLKDRQKYLDSVAASTSNRRTSLAASVTPPIATTYLKEDTQKTVWDHYIDGYERTRAGAAEMPHTEAAAQKHEMALNNSIAAYEKAVRDMPGSRDKFIPEFGAATESANLTYGEHGQRLIEKLKQATDNHLNVTLDTSWANHAANTQRIGETLKQLNALITDRMTTQGVIGNISYAARAKQIETSLIGNQITYVTNLDGLTQYNVYKQFEAESIAASEANNYLER